MNNPQQNNDNVNWQNAMNLVKYTHQSVFLTGKAGTGKSTFAVRCIAFSNCLFTLCCQMILTCHCNGDAYMNSSNIASRTVSCWKSWNLSSSTRFLWCELIL